MIVVVVLPATGIITKKENSKPIRFNYNIRIEFAPGELIVKLKKNTTFSNMVLTTLNKKHQVYAFEKLFQNTQNTNLDNIYRLRVPLESDILSFIHEYASYPDVVYAEPNGIVHPCCVPNDAHFCVQWSLDNTGQMILGNVAGFPDADIDAPEAWDIGRGSPAVVIAIIDSGIDYTHPDLASRIWMNTNEIQGNGIDDDYNGFIDDVIGWNFPHNDNDPKDGHGHGTLCAGTAAAVTDNGIGIASAGWNCTIMPVQIANESWVAYWTDIAAAIKYAADNGADVISMSFGSYAQENIVRDAVNYAYELGVFLCAAAGNDNLKNKFYPAAYENVTAVAATNQNDQRCTKQDWDPHNYWPGELRGSNGGSWVDIAAPGTLIYSTMPMYHVTFNAIINPHTGHAIVPEYDWYGGTSSASPLVAGIAALLVSKNPSISPDGVKALLCRYVDPYNSTTYIGTGRINAQKALTALLLSPKPPTITGPATGKIRHLYNYIFNSTDPDGDTVSYVIDWGDGDVVNQGPFSSGEAIVVSHKWHRQGMYIVKAKAKDHAGHESDWGILQVAMPYLNNVLFQSFWDRLFERFPCIFPLLQHLLLWHFPPFFPLYGRVHITAVERINFEVIK